MSAERDHHWAKLGEIGVRQFIKEMSPSAARSEAMDWMKRHEAARQEADRAVAKATANAEAQKTERQERLMRQSNRIAIGAYVIAIISLLVALVK